MIDQKKELKGKINKIGHTFPQLGKALHFSVKEIAFQDE